MKVRSLRVNMLAMTLAVALFLAGCASKSSVNKDNDNSQDLGLKGKPVTIRIAWWGNQARHDKTLKAIELYKSKYPNVSFDTEYNSFKGYWDKLAAEAAANNLPDIIQQDYTYLGQWVDKKLLEDLTLYTEKKRIDTSSINHVYLSGGKVKGGLYGISLGVNTLQLIYDPEIFKKAGVPIPDQDQTWEEFENSVIKVYNVTGIPGGILLNDDPKYLLEYMVRETGKSLYKTDGTGLGFDDHTIVSGLFEMMHRMSKAGALISPEASTTVATVQEDFMVKGAVSVSANWSNYYNSLANYTKRPLGLSQLPKNPNGVRPGLYLRPSMFFSISKASENKTQAADFIDYFINDISVNRELAAERGVPVSSKVRDALKSNLDAVNKQVFQYVEAVEKNSSPIDPPEPPHAGEVTKMLKSIWDEVLFDKLTPQDAADTFMQKANEILAKNK